MPKMTTSEWLDNYIMYLIVAFFDWKLILQRWNSLIHNLAKKISNRKELNFEKILVLIFKNNSFK